MKTRSEHITESIKRLNANYGRGDVRNVMVFFDGRIEFTRQPFGMKTEKRIGRINGNTVYALGHQITFKESN